MPPQEPKTRVFCIKSTRSGNARRKAASPASGGRRRGSKSSQSRHPDDFEGFTYHGEDAFLDDDRR